MVTNQGKLLTNSGCGHALFNFVQHAMRSSPVIDVIIPARNEAGAIGRVIRDIPKGLIRQVVVCDNGSTDKTAEAAKAAGATVVYEDQPGYGRACLAGIRHLTKAPEEHPDIVVFMDGDYSDYPEDMRSLISEIGHGQDLVIGSRTRGNAAKGSLTVPQRFGNWLATRMIRFLYGFEFTDLGPFRAIRFESLLQLQMVDTTYGWTVEMQVKALNHGLRCAEVPVRYRPRIGKSKISGTLLGSIMAGYKIIHTILKYRKKR